MSERIVSLHAGYDNEERFVDGYVARPAAAGVRPAVVLISGMSGLNWFQRQITRTFAEAGFVTLSPDLFDGARPEGRTPALLQKNSLELLQIQIFRHGLFLLSERDDAPFELAPLLHELREVGIRRKLDIAEPFGHRGFAHQISCARHVPLVP